MAGSVSRNVVFGKYICGSPGDLEIRSVTSIVHVIDLVFL